MADGAGSLTLREAVADALYFHLQSLLIDPEHRPWLRGSHIERPSPLEYRIVSPGRKPRSIVIKISERRG